MTALRIIDSHLELADIGSNTHAQIDTGLTKLAGIESGAAADQTKADIDGLGLSHDSLVDVSANDHHNELHSIVSHNDTSATGTQLDTLTDNSIADALHRHSELVASDGAPDPAVQVAVDGRVGIGIAPTAQLHVYKGEIGTIGRYEGAGNEFLGMRQDSEGDWRIYAYDTETLLHVPISFGNDTIRVDSPNQRVGIGTLTPATSAKLELSSTTGAILLTRMTTTQRDALTAVNGMVLYNSTLNKFQGYENGAWTSLI
ncbi:MAG: hypothetical protein IMF20_02325 [Proteobacteria bacterium]|nr:hypothetical protein [Pseudomonadota bacterium]